MFKTPSQFTGMTHKADGSASVRFVTQEMTAQQKLQLIEHLNLAGWLLFSEDTLNEAPKEDSGFEEGKKPSQRLRSIMFVYWKQKKSETYPSFDTWYKSQMELIINQFREKLDN